MTDITFERLRDVALREAWPHEAHAFTPWLAKNIDHIAEAIGIPLELTGTEVAVENFSADILARNPHDDSVVLIENQLETTDHTHLGQIMTYLAGLEAKTIVWIAPNFRAAHLSAIHWLNKHTAEAFAFFALRLRVVRIGDSPYAPIFEVVAQPSDWDRTLRSRVMAANSTPNDAKFRFWTAYALRRPDLTSQGLVPQRLSNVWINLMSDPEINLSLYIGKRTSGAFLRGARGTSYADLADMFLPAASALADLIGTPFVDTGSRGYYFETSVNLGLDDPECWPKIMDWMDEAVSVYRNAVQGAFAGPHA